MNRTLPCYLKLGQSYSGIVRDQTTRDSLKVAEPMVLAHGEAARTQVFLQSLQPQRNRMAASTILKKRKRNREPQDTSAAHRRRRWRIPRRRLCWIASERKDEDDQGNALSAVKSLGPMDYLALGIALLTLARQFGGMLKKA